MENRNNPIAKTLEKTKLTQDELATKLNVSRQTISNYMADPDKIPHSIINELLKITGYSYDVLFGGIEKVKGPVLQRCYPDIVKSIKEKLVKAKNQYGIISKITVDRQESYVENRKKEIAEEFENIQKIAWEQSRKVTVCAYGESDTGKSTLMNQILHDEVAPTNYSPVTSAVTYFRHISEKPAYLDINENAVVYGRKKGEDLAKFQHHFCDDEQLAKKYIIREGDYLSILNAFGTRTGAYFNNTQFYVDEIDVFLDNTALEELTLIDIPGFGSDLEQDNIGLTMDMSKFDVIIYLSLANGFFRGEDITAIKQILRSRESLSSLYIMATHANAVGDPIKIKEIIKDGCRRLANSMTDNELNRLKLSMENLEALHQRCFGYDVYNELYCKEFNSDFEKVIPELNQKRVENAQTNLQEVCHNMVEKYEELQEHADQDEDIDLDEERRCEFRKELEDAEKGIADRMAKCIKRCRDNSTNRFYKEYEEVLNEDFLFQALERKGIKNKKDDLKEFSSYVCSEINDRLVTNLEENSKDFVEELNANIEDYENIWKQSYKDHKIFVDMSSFDFTRAFAAGLSGVAVYGALAVWATIVAAGSNLGGYILLAKVVSALSALGISVGGTGAAAAFVASIGGPVTLAIGIALLAAITMFGILSGNWKSRYVKKLIKTFRDKGMKQECEECIKKYWNDTQEALNACLKSLKKQSVDYYEQEIIRRSLSDKVKAYVNYAMQLIYSNIISIYRIMQ